MTESLSASATNHIDFWKSKLIDLTRRNRLLYYKPTKRSTLFIASPEINVIFSRLVLSGKSWKFWFPPDEDEQSDAESSQTLEIKEPKKPLAKKKVQATELVCKNISYKGLELSLKNLRRRSHADYQERGVRILHVAFGMLHWSEVENGIDRGAVISPILLCPVELTRETACDPCFLSTVEEEIVLNPALVTKLQNDFDLTLPPLPEEWEESSLDEYLDAVNKLIEPLAWSVEKSAVIGLFSFHKLVIHNDLALNAPLVADHPLVRQLIGEAEGGCDLSASEERIPTERELDAIQLPSQTFQILDADSSQQVCIQTALRGHSFVLQGPPGTGKSQTIANLIAEFIAREKKVLFVSEKMAALEVVSKRLQENGLSDFCLELHSHKSNKRKVVTELKRCLDERLTPTHLPTEADFYSLSQLRDRLNEYVHALHEMHEPLERNAYEVLGELASRHNFPSISLKPSEDTTPSALIDTNNLTQSQVQELAKWVEHLQTLWVIHSEGEKFPWWGCSDNEFTLDSRVEWDALLTNLNLALERFNAITRQCSDALGLDAPLNLQGANRLSQIIKHLNCSPGIPESWVTDSNLKTLLQESQEYQRQSKQYWEYHEQLSSMYRPEFFELEVGLAEELSAALQNVHRLFSQDSSNENFVSECPGLLAFLNSTTQIVTGGQKELTKFYSILQQYSEKLGLDIPVNLSDAKQLGRIVEHLKVGPGILESWTIEGAFRSLLQESQVLLEQSQQYWTSHDELSLMYRPEFFELQDNFADQLNVAWESVRKLLSDENSGKDLLTERHELLKFLNRTRQMAANSQTDTEAIALRFDLHIQNPTLARCLDLAELAQLSVAQPEPAPNWLNTTSLRQIQSLVEQLEPTCKEYHRRRAILLERYDLSFFELDLDSLITNFDGTLYRSVLHHFHPGFYKDKNAVLRTTRANNLPQTIVEDLLEARELTRSERQLDAKREQIEALLLGFYDGFDTDFNTINQAVEIANEILKLTPEPLPAKMIEFLSKREDERGDLRAKGERLESSISEWKTSLQDEKVLSLLQKMPGLNLSFSQLDASAIEEWSLSLLGALSELYGLIDIIALHRKTMDGAELNGLIIDLRRNESMRPFLSLLKGQNELLKEKFGDRFQGIHTQWQEVTDSLNWTRGLFDLLQTTVLPVKVQRLAMERSADLASDDLVEAMDRVGQLFKELQIHFSESCSLMPNILNEPIPQIELLAIEGWVSSLLNALNGLFSLIHTVSIHRKTREEIELIELIADLRKNESIRQILSFLKVQDEVLKKTFGDRFRGIQTEWQEVTDGLNWTLKLCDLMQGSVVPSRVVHLAVEGNGQLDSDELDENAKQTDDLLRKLQAHFSLPMPNIVMGDEKEIDKLHLDTVEKSVRLLMSTLDDLQLWTDYKSLKAKFERSGLGSFLSRLEAAPPAPGHLVDIFYKSIYQDWISNIFTQDARLNRFRGRNQDNLIKEFRELDQKLVQCAGQRIIERCNSMRPQSSFLSIRHSEVGTIRREAAKERKHLPLRKLFERIPNLLSRLKPCLLMSPLSVSQFLSSGPSHFDLVIFDEASQIFTEDAICAIYRSDQFVIAGDSKQLPPTNFFTHVDSDDDEINEEDEVEIPEDFKSLLDECGAKFPEYMLRWHYRSRHESLIDFSNHRFYNDRLVTFPASDHESSTLGVKLLYVPDGVYDRGGKRNNQREAEVVVDQVFEHFANYPKKSLGVVAFSQAQKTTIEDEIERRKKLQPEMESFFKEDRLGGFFVKNLENIQGDERDVIIFSIGYGYDSSRKITMNFGPVSRSGGERRLNVAVTRAREKVLVVSSIKASDIDLDKITQAGGRHLYHYLDYAERGEAGLKLEEPLPEGETKSPFEDEVAAAIRNLGYDVVPRVGCSGYRIDLGIIDVASPGHFLLGVECDGATYHSASTARDRDRLRQQVLENLGWSIHRIWSPDWVTKRDSEITRLSAAIQNAHDGKVRIETVPEKIELSKEKPQVKLATPKVRSGGNSLLPGTTFYKLYELKNSSGQRDSHSQQLAEIIHTEGPIHIGLAVYRLTRAIGIHRSGHRIQSSFQKMVQSGEKQNLWIRKEEFLWPPDMLEPPVRVPNASAPDTKRDLSQIAPEEIEMAMILIIREVAGISQEALITETARLFGFKRVGDKIRFGLFDAFTRLQANETIVETNGIVSLTSIA